jgi:hypothetical protein
MGRQAGRRSSLICLLTTMHIMDLRNTFSLPRYTKMMIHASSSPSPLCMSGNAILQRRRIKARLPLNYLGEPAPYTSIECLHTLIPNPSTRVPCATNDDLPLSMPAFPSFPINGALPLQQYIPRGHCHCGPAFYPKHLIIILMYCPPACPPCFFPLYPLPTTTHYLIAFLN